MPAKYWTPPHLIAAAVVAVFASLCTSHGRAGEAIDPVAVQSRALIFGTSGEVRDALTGLRNRGKADVAAAMILAMRYNRAAGRNISIALTDLTGHRADRWFDWMIWQERHPEITPHDTYADLKLEVFQRVDPAFRRFFPDGETLDRMRIRLEEVSWGGVAVDGIPALDNPELIRSAEADYLRDEDLVFGVEINGDARAYPLRILGWHEMVNDVVGGVPLALAYCTLCGSGILFETAVPGWNDPLVFGSSGLLYRSNKLMFDRQTDSLWNQFTGEPVSGPLVDKNIALTIRPVVITSWAEWRAVHPDTRVLSLNTGHRRDYGSGVVYRDYFASPDLMFPSAVDETLFRQKEYVFGVRDVGAAKAWPLDVFADGAVINDTVGRRDIVLIGEQATRTVRAYDRGARTFTAAANPSLLKHGDELWLVGEEALTGPNGSTLPRVPGHIAYWFAWNSYLGRESEIYGAVNN